MAIMNKPHRLARLVSGIGRGTGALAALVVCASTYADTSKDLVTPKQARSEVAAQSPRLAGVPKRRLYALVSTSAIPEPLERVTGTFVTTSSPMIVIGRRPGE